MDTIFLVLALMAYALVRGYHRRRPYWSRESWLRFGAVCGLGLVVFAGFFALNHALTEGALRSSVMSANERAYWILGALGLMLIGAGLVAPAIVWLALGEPTRQFPDASRGEAQ